MGGPRGADGTAVGAWLCCNAVNWLAARASVYSNNKGLAARTPLLNKSVTSLVLGEQLEFSYVCFFLFETVDWTSCLPGPVLIMCVALAMDC